MNYFNLTQQAGIEDPSLFPFPFNMHLIFVCIGTIFFVYRFLTQKRPFQLIMAIALPLSLLLHLSESKILFYGIAIAEAVLILAAAVTSMIFKAPYDEEDAEEESEDDESKNEEEISSENKVEETADSNESETEEEA